MMLQSEDDFLALIDRHFSNTAPGILTGRGDDCAVLGMPSEVCLTTDLFLENIHFRLDYFDPGDVGHKALAVNLSDIAGMGGTPLGFALGLMVREGFGEEFFDPLFSAMAALSNETGCPLVGGDLSRADRLGLSITVWGSAQRYLYRKHCRQGDILVLAGVPGLARAGLMALEDAGRQAARTSFPEAVKAHLRPRVDFRAARMFAACPAVKGLMDVSDGLARDLPRFLGPGLGVDVALSDDLLHPEVREFVVHTGEQGLEFALLGGEDYALLGAVEPRGLGQLKKDVPGLLVLGSVLERPGLWKGGRQLRLNGFDHFKEQS